MKSAYLYCFIIIYVLMCSTMAIDLPMELFYTSSNLENTSLSQNVKILKNVSNLLPDAIFLSNATHKRETLLVIGEVALSQAEKNLDRLSQDNHSLKLIESGQFAGMHSEISPAFGIRKIPIKLIKYEPKERQRSQDYNFSSRNDLINASNTEQFVPEQPSIQTYEISKGHRESAGGVDVIWDY